MVAALQEKKVDLVCLAGYMRLLSPYFVAAFRDRILNIHPSLLPAFPGLEAQRQALEHGVKFPGCTVHFVDENLDAGPIVLQAAVPIEDSDTPETLSERILREEHRIYSEAVRIVLEGRYRIEGARLEIPINSSAERKKVRPQRCWRMVVPGSVGSRIIFWGWRALDDSHPETGDAAFLIVRSVGLFIYFTALSFA